MAPVNPYSAENLAKRKAAMRAQDDRWVKLYQQDQKRKKKRKPKDLLVTKTPIETKDREPPADAFSVLMNSHAKEIKKRKERQKDPTRSIRGAVSAGGRNTKRRAKNQRYEREEDSSSLIDDATKKGLRVSGASFRATTLKVYQTLQDTLKDRVGYEEGTNNLCGSWPSLFHAPTIDPTADPYTFFDGNFLTGNSFAQLPKRNLFACRPCMFWAPEFRWPKLSSADTKPYCVYHPGETSCVSPNGYSSYFRCVYDVRGTTALNGREYICTRNRKKKERCTFYSYDSGVIHQSSPYVQAFWRQHGYKLTHRGGVRWIMIDEMRSLLAHGLSGLGYVNSIMERYKQEHALQRKKWRSYSESVLQETNTAFFDFESPDSQLSVPSLSFMLSATLEEIESFIPFYRHKMTMNGGLCLSGDHFIKIGKVVLIDNEKGFVGLYSVMNEFGKILLWRLVNGTTLYEVESSLRGLNRRYKLHGFKGPILFTTDRCCHERSFFEGAQNNEKKPIFDSFIVHEMIPESAEDQQATQPRRTQRVKYLDLEAKPITFSTKALAESAACDIIAICTNKGWDVVSLDSEWTIGTKSGPATIQITTEDLQTYIFRKPYPKGLVTLLESPNIKKVASKISADRTKLAEIGIRLQGEINLQTMAKERGVIEFATFGLETIFNTMFDPIKLKKDQVTRTSNWDVQDLDERQEQYAALDALAQMLCYLKIRSVEFVDHRSNAAPPLRQLQSNDQLLLYTANGATVVATGRFKSAARVKSIFGQTYQSSTVCTIQIDEVRRPAAKVLEHENETLEQLQLAHSGNDALEINWPVAHTRRASSSMAIAFTACVYTKDVDVPVRYNENEQDPMSKEAMPQQCQFIDADTDSVDEADTTENLATEKEAEALYHAGRIKQDIEHIFIRFARYLSKKHGLFGIFMARLSDVFYVPNHEDVSFIKAALRRAGMTNDDINSLPWRFFKGRVRRRVPSPKELELNFNKLVNLMANIEDAKTGKPLFGPKAWNLYKATLRHIQKGCLSDVPGLVYYVQIGEDSCGIPIFKCLRGTSALEGFHQKVRQLLRGFNISPRFAVAILYEFIHRWNHDRDIQILGLSSEYANFYDGWTLEEEVEALGEWKELRNPPHPEIECTQHFGETSEEFGVVSSEHNWNAEENVEMAASNVADAFLDGSWETVLNPSEDSTSPLELQQLTASAAWVAEKLGRKRGAKRVGTETERGFFRKHYVNYQGNSSSVDGAAAEADNFSSIRWGDFALFWNSVLKDEDEGRRETTDMTYKNAFMLMEHYQLMKREGNVAATALSIMPANNEMRRELRGNNRETAAVFEDNVAVTIVMRDTGIHKRSAVSICDPFARLGNDEEETTSFADFDDEHPESDIAPELKRVTVNQFTGRTPVDPEKYITAKVLTASVTKRAPRRCRDCGLDSDAAKWSVYHQGTTSSSSRGVFYKCTTPPEGREPGFPVPKGSRLPKRSTKLPDVSK